MDKEAFLSRLKRSKFDYAILVTVLILITSNQLLAVIPYRASGAIEVTNGATIPEESNYTISREFNPSVTSAVVMNYTLEDDVTLENEIGIAVSLVTDNVSRFVVNITIQSTLNNTDVDIRVELGVYRTTIHVVVGTTATTFSVEPDMDLVCSNPIYWIPYFIVRFTTDIELEFRNVLLWAEFDTPVSPVVLNWQSTDGEPLFVNPYTKWMRYFNPELRIERQSGGSYGVLDARFQNRTLYLTPQNYTMEATWGDEIPSIPAFSLSISENYTTICTLRMKAVKLTLSLNQNIPLIHLEIHTYHWSNSFLSYSRIYDLYLQDSEIPEFLFFPPFNDGFTIRFSSIDTLSRHLLYSSDVDTYAFEHIPESGTYHLNAEILMPYWHIFEFIITPQNFVLLSLGMVLFSLVLFRVRIYFNQKKPRVSWRDPLLLPVIVLGLTAFIPWFSSIREVTYGFHTTIHAISFGPFPLVASWTDSGGIFLDIPQSGFYWAILSMLFFWLPLQFANYSMTPPRASLMESLLPLFSPLLILGFVQVGLGEIYTFPFSHDLLIEILLLFIPAVFFCCYIVLRITGRWN